MALSAATHPDDQTDHSLVPDSVPQKFDHPRVVDRIKERSDVGLHYMIDSFLLDRPSERIQTLVWAAPRSVSIAAVFEYGLVDGFQRPFRRFLNNLVFEFADS